MKKMSQDQFNNLMYAIVGVGLVIGFLLAIPRAANFYANEDRIANTPSHQVTKAPNDDAVYLSFQLNHN